MNNQAEQVLTQLLQRAVDGVDKAVEFSQAQIPDVVEQLFLWHTLQSASLFVLGVMVLVGSSVAGLIAGKIETQRTGDPFFSVILSCAFIIVGVKICVEHLDWLQILIAPKLYLIEYAAELAK